MATADISKEAVFDGRIVQLPARYAVNKSALSLTNSPYQAISASSSQHTYNINVPSQNVFVDRAIDWSSGVKLNFRISCAGSPQPLAGVNNQAVVVFGRDLALCAFPLTSLVNTTTATINDTSVTINTDTVFREVLRLTDYKKNRISRTCPTMLDKFAEYSSANNAVNSPLADYLAQTESAERPNGAWHQIRFINPNNGNVLVGGTNGAPLNYVFDGVTVNFVSGIPCRTPAPAAEPAFYPLAIEFFSTEKLILSPFIFANACEWDTGLFGVNNIQLVLNMKAEIQRVLRNNPNSGRNLLDGSVAYNATGTSPFISPTVNVQYLTPSLDLPLPPKSVVPYMEFPRYLTTTTLSVPAQQEAQIQSQTIVLPQIPDALLIYVKPGSYSDTEGDWYLPIRRITVNFDNFAGLLSSHTAEQLYSMSVHNGLDMDWSMYSGEGVSAALGGTNVPDGAVQPFRVQTVGGFLVLKPGQDITLQSGQAPGLIGNFTLQFTVTVYNPRQLLAVNNPVLYVISVNSGYFETLAGSSRIVKGVLSEADIIGAPPAAEMTSEGISRIVGAGFFDRIGSFISKAKDIYTATKPVVSAVKGMLPEEGTMGKIKSGLSAVGYGRAGAGAAGAGMAGAGRAGGRKSLSDRLM